MRAPSQAARTRATDGNLFRVGGRSANGGAEAEGADREQQARETAARSDAPATVRPTATTPTVADLMALRGGRDRLLPVKEVAQELGVCAATVYQLCERGDVPHVRIINSIRVRPRDLAAFMADAGS